MFWAKFLVVPIALAMCVGVTDQIDPDYNGEVDLISGEAVTESDDGEINSPYVAIPMDNGGANAVYDMKNAVYRYTCPGCHNTIVSTIADGLLTNSKVSISHEKGEPLKLFRNGEEVDNADLSNISAPGRYSVVVTGVNVEHSIMSFSIAGKKSSEYTDYRLPSGFDFTEVVYNDEKMELKDLSKVELSEDGKYEIAYRCIATGVRYNLELNVDHTPPQFTLQGVSDYSAGGPVTIVDEDKSDSITVLFNDGGAQKAPSDGVLTAPGRYTVIVTDDAGNTVSEDFEIRFYLNVQGWIFALLLIAAIVAVIVFMKYSKKNLRVR